MTDKPKPKKLNDKFKKAVETLANTKPISNKELIKRTKKK